MYHADSYEQRHVEHYAGEKAPPGEIVSAVRVPSEDAPIAETAEGTFVLRGDAWEATDESARTEPIPLPMPWRRHVEEGQAISLARIGDEAAVVWSHNELLLIGRDGHSEVMLKEFPAPLGVLHCGSPGADGTLWFGGRQGAVCLRKGQWEYWAGPRYLPSDEVLAIAADADGGAWVATSAGLTHLSRVGMTLEAKAAFYEGQIEARHRRFGYVTSCRLAGPGDTSSHTHDASDNDGLWTAIYSTAECFRYAVTGDPEARRLAWESTKALLDLERRTPISGFPARALVRVGEDVSKSGGEWHVTEVYHAPGEAEQGPSPDGAWEWKGDTSSDELDGHYFGLSIYYDLVANDAEKQEIREVVERMTDHLIDNGFLLIDLDGEPTRWGVFSPELLNGSWEPERGLNSLSILSHLRTAHHICGHERYLAAARGLIEDHHYALNTLNQKIMPPGEINHSDDELAFVCYYPLLRYEIDPDLRQLYLLSFERSWRLERPERNPLWNLMYGALTGNACDAGAAAQTLGEIPLDLCNWPIRNSVRNDIEVAPGSGRFGEVESTYPVRADELPAGRWNANPYRLDGGGDGSSEEDGAQYLLPYWLGRYHGLIE